MVTEVMAIVVPRSAFDCFLHQPLREGRRGAAETKDSSVAAALLSSQQNEKSEREVGGPRNCTLSLFSATHHPVAAGLTAGTTPPCCCVTVDAPSAAVASVLSVASSQHTGREKPAAKTAATKLLRSLHLLAELCLLLLKLAANLTSLHDIVTNQRYTLHGLLVTCDY